MTHRLDVLVICTKFHRNPSMRVEVTERTRQVGLPDGRTEGRTDG